MPFEQELTCKQQTANLGGICKLAYPHSLEHATSLIIHQRRTKGYGKTISVTVFDVLLNSLEASFLELKFIYSMEKSKHLDLHI